MGYHNDDDEEDDEDNNDNTIYVSISLYRSISLFINMPAVPPCFFSFYRAFIPNFLVPFTALPKAARPSAFPPISYRVPFILNLTVKDNRTSCVLFTVCIAGHSKLSLRIRF